MTCSGLTVQKIITSRRSTERTRRRLFGDLAAKRLAAVAERSAAPLLNAGRTVSVVYGGYGGFVCTRGL
jgi:hypothetical protein